MPAPFRGRGCGGTMADLRIRNERKRTRECISAPEISVMLGGEGLVKLNLTCGRSCPTQTRMTVVQLRQGREGSAAKVGTFGLAELRPVKPSRRPTRTKGTLGGGLVESQALETMVQILGELRIRPKTAGRTETT